MCEFSSFVNSPLPVFNEWRLGKPIIPSLFFFSHYMWPSHLRVDLDSAQFPREITSMSAALNISLLMMWLYSHLTGELKEESGHEHHSVSQSIRKLWLFFLIRLDSGFMQNMNALFCSYVQMIKVHRSSDVTSDCMLMSVCEQGKHYILWMRS